MRTVSENKALLDKSFDMTSINVESSHHETHLSHRSTFYEFGVDNNDFIEELWKESDDSIVEDINKHFE